MYFNILIVMLLGGLWHGASWQFVIWGGIHGVVLVIHKIYLELFQPKRSGNLLIHAISVFITFHIVQFAWIFFRAPDMKTVGEILGQLYNAFGWEHIADMITSYKSIFFLILLAYLIHWFPLRLKLGIENLFIITPQWAKVLVIVIVFSPFTSSNHQISNRLYIFGFNTLVAAKLRIH